MYQNNRRNSNYQGARSRFARQNRRPRQIKKLDTSLLIRKAVESCEMEYVPTNSFADFAFIPELTQNINHRGYSQPTPIQDQAIPILLTGRDLIGIAQTGTGKTAAFLLPLIQKVFNDRTEKVLIIAPTRELAVQIENEFRIFAYGMNIYAATVIGGMNIDRQISQLLRQPNFVIGTPGRLIDLSKQGKLKFNVFSSVVMDEVDRMFDMGFIDAVRYIADRLPKVRHSMFFSATVPPAVRGLIETFLINPVTVSLKKEDTSDHVNQDIIRVNGKSKIEILHDLLIKKEFEKVLLFGRTKWGVDKLLDSLLSRGFKAAAIHGNKRQSQRQRALDEFKKNRIQILLATDIASRGIDVSDVTHVINYDMPESYEDYIHRIGRTGRADKYGTALTFID